MNLIINVLRSISSAIVTPPLMFILIALLVVLFFKNKKIAGLQKMIIGGSVNSPIELTLSQFVLGTVAGAVGSIFLTLLGIHFDDNSGIQYLFFVSIILMLIKPKFICFSYSASILGFISILSKLINLYAPEVNSLVINVDILYLMMFIGALHIIEGLLVMIDGHRGVIPIFAETDGEIVGGYKYKRYWILPVALMMSASSFSNGISVNTPDWWPMIKSNTGNYLGYMFMVLSTCYAMIGYSTMSFTRSKKEQPVISGLFISGYGFILLIVSQLCKFGILGEIAVVIFAPAGHELMMIAQRFIEDTRELKFSSAKDGLVVLDVSKDSQLKKFGIQIGCRIVSVNDKCVNTEKEIYSILRTNLYKVKMSIKYIDGTIKEIDYNHDNKKRLGVLLVPKKVKDDDKLKVDANKFREVLNEIKKAREEKLKE